MKTRFFIFGRGLTQDTDDRLKDIDSPRDIQNLVKRKNGRLGVRFDYDALVMTDTLGAVTLFDLMTHDDRLLAMGKSPFSTTPVLESLFEYVNQSYGWSCMEQQTFTKGSLGHATHVRAIHTTVSSLTGIPASPDTMGDVAAGSGRAVVLYRRANSASFAAAIIDASSGQSLAPLQILVPLLFARVVCTGTKFFICGVDSSTFAIKLFVYDPAVSGVFTSLTDPAAAGGAVTCFDMSLSHEGTTFWVTYNRAGPTTRIHGFDVNGTETDDFAGSALAYNRITIFAEAINGAQRRLHWAGVLTAGAQINLITYTNPGNAVESTSLAAFGGATASGQVGLTVRNEPVTNRIFAMFSDSVADTGLKIASYTNNTHVISDAVSTMVHLRLGSKPVHFNGHVFASLSVPQSNDTERTHMLFHLDAAGTQQLTYPEVKSEPLLAVDSQADYLTTIARDASTNSFLWIRYNLLAVPTVFEKLVSGLVSRMFLCGTHRRQAMQIADMSYIAGARLTSYDGTFVAENAFLYRPRIISVAQGGGGAVALLSTHQYVVVYEYRDTNNNRVQSEPSDVMTVTMTGANNLLTFTVQAPRQARMAGAGGLSSCTSALYATLDSNQGNLTFHRIIENSVPSSGADYVQSMGQADSTVSEGEILYSQGARGALSGPLVFESPPASISVAASADRGFLGGMERTASVQESRPHFENEQMNWSNALGFARDARGVVLAVARLDERRIIWTENEIFEMDGPGLDDNGNGDLGAPRRLPSDVGLYGGELGWRSIVECSLGILFQGLSDHIYLLPRGGVTPVDIGFAVEDKLALFSVITSATYLPDDQTVRFTCNNVGGTDGIVLLLDVRFQEWFIEGPFGAAITAGTRFENSFVMLRSGTVFKQRTSHPPAAFIPTAWKSGTIHPFGPGAWGQIDSMTVSGEYRGDCYLNCTVTFDDLVTEVLDPAFVNGLTVGDPYSHKFTPNQQNCEAIRYDVTVTDSSVPIIAFETQQSFPTAAQLIDVSIPGRLQPGDRIVVGVAANVITGAAQILLPAGYTSLGAFSAITVTLRTFFRVVTTTNSLDASTLTVDLAATNISAALAKVWIVRGGSPLTAPASALAATAATPIDFANLVTGFGTVPTLFLIFVALQSDGPAPPVITAFPAGFIGTGELRNTGGTADLDGAIGWGSSTQTVSALNPSAITYAADAGATTAIGSLMAFAPGTPSEGLVLHYTSFDYEATEVSALKAPSQMS